LGQIDGFAIIQRRDGSNRPPVFVCSHTDLLPSIKSRAKSNLGPYNGYLSARPLFAATLP
jgi:hypothetical protein